MKLPSSLVRFLIAGTLSLASLTAMAMPPLADAAAMPGPPLTDDAPPPPFLHGILLSDGQQDQVFEIMHRAAPTLRAKAREARRAQQALHELSLSGSYDEAKARALADAVAHAVAEIALLRAGIDNQTVRLLTPEQRKQLDAAKPCTGEHPLGQQH